MHNLIQNVANCRIPHNQEYQTSIHAGNDPDWRSNANRGNSHNRMSDNTWTSSGRADRDPNWRSPEPQAYSLFPTGAPQLLWDPNQVLNTTVYPG